MSKTIIPKISRQQFKVLRVLWSKGNATTEEIQIIMSMEKSIKRTSVQTFLKELVRKKIISYEVKDRTYVYHSLYDKDIIIQHAIVDCLHFYFDGDLNGFLEYLNNKSDHISEILLDT